MQCHFHRISSAGHRFVISPGSVRTPSCVFCCSQTVSERRGFNWKGKVEEQWLNQGWHLPDYDNGDHDNGDGDAGDDDNGDRDDDNEWWWLFPPGRTRADFCWLASPPPAQSDPAIPNILHVIMIVSYSEQVCLLHNCDNNWNNNCLQLQLWQKMKSSSPAAVWSPQSAALFPLPKFETANNFNHS